MLDKHIFQIDSSESFTSTALKAFLFQYINNNVYKSFCDLIGVNPKKINTLEEIPFLPVSFFKTHKVISSKDPEELTFSSSGTTGMTRSLHHITKKMLYQKSFTKGFQTFYGVNKYTIVALLPSYLEQPHSSLIYMVRHLIKNSNSIQGGFFKGDITTFKSYITSLDQDDQPVILIGVPYALLDVLDKDTFSLKNTIIMETGGMKGKRPEMIKENLHHILSEGFGVKEIHSEYGMTELLSQAYSKGRGIYKCPPWMRVLPGEIDNPIALGAYGKLSGLRIIDLANLYSCSFIASEDIGRVYEDGSFEILGRFDYADLRGCNLMLES